MKPALVLSFALAACGGGSSSKPAPTTTTTTTTTAKSTTTWCPVEVAGTSVSVEDAPNGAALVFVTTGDVSELRRRVAEIAKMHNEHHAQMGALPEGKDAGGGHAGHDMSGHAGHDMSGHAGHDMSGHAGHDMKGMHHGGPGGMIGMHSKATATDVEGGAKLQITVDAADVAKLQSELRMHAQHLGSGTCAMDHAS